MASANFLQRVGASSCIGCDFKTDSSQSFEEQDAAMMEHLTAEHPNWMLDKVRHTPLEWGSSCPQAPDRGPHECNGACDGRHRCLRCGCWCLCQWCNDGNPRTQSSVSDRMVHTDTPVGRVMCIDEPEIKSVGEESSNAPASGNSEWSHLSHADAQRLRWAAFMCDKYVNHRTGEESMPDIKEAERASELIYEVLKHAGVSPNLGTQEPFGIPPYAQEAK